MQLSDMAWSLVFFALVATFAASQGLDTLNNVQSNNPFLLEEPSQVIRTNAGEIKLYNPRHGHLFSKFKLALLRMKPNALLLPQYISAKSIFLIQEGNATLAWVKEDEEVRMNMEMGDAYAIPEGTVFYILNQDEQNFVEIIWLMEPEDSDEEFVQPALVGGGAETLLSGFDIEVMASAFKVTKEEMANLLSSQTIGPIISISKENFSSLNRVRDPASSPTWKQTWMNLLKDFIPENKNKKDKTPEAFNIFAQKSFENQYGWTVSAEGKKILKGTNVGLFAVHLEAAAMLVPHWNPYSVEIAVVKNGTGIVQISYPNGTNALNTRVKKGSIVLVPRFLPVVQIADENSEFEFVGFTLSSRSLKKDHAAQFLAGVNSVLKKLSIASLAASVGVPEDLLSIWLDAQQGSVIVPGPAHPDLASLSNLKGFSALSK